MKNSKFVLSFIWVTKAKPIKPRTLEHTIMPIFRSKCTKKHEISKEIWQNLHIGAGFVHFQNIFLDKTR
jgi:hypothetical protein